MWVQIRLHNLRLSIDVGGQIASELLKVLPDLDQETLLVQVVEQLNIIE
jgi:hypothetical protein